jgi:hypothetical protein
MQKMRASVVLRIRIDTLFQTLRILSRFKAYGCLRELTLIDQQVQFAGESRFVLSKSVFNPKQNTLECNNTDLRKLQILRSGVWGTVCTDGWNTNDARVVCRQLNQSNGSVFTIPPCPAGTYSTFAISPNTAEGDCTLCPTGSYCPVMAPFPRPSLEMKCSLFSRTDS